jgi:hypothetical protein
METLRIHLALKNPRFECWDHDKKHSITVKLRSAVGKPSTVRELKTLQKLAGKEYAVLEPLYREFNGLTLYMHRKTAGLAVAPIKELPAFAADCKTLLFGDEAELYPFQREGVPFATIVESGNYFVLHEGKVYYSDHDGGDDSVWSTDLEDFFTRAVSNPPKFLYDAGCYTRYFDGKTDTQFIPETFIHD